MGCLSQYTLLGGWIVQRANRGWINSPTASAKAEISHILKERKVYAHASTVTQTTHFAPAERLANHHRYLYRGQPCTQLDSRPYQTEWYGTPDPYFQNCVYPSGPPEYISYMLFTDHSRLKPPTPPVGR
jgi:hypothetical protein